MAQSYAKPCGFHYGAPARALIDQGAALALGGTPLAFTHVEVLSREDPARLLGVVDWMKHEADDAVVHRLTAPRPDLSGLSLDVPKIMGILNVTPDSFSDGGSFTDVEVAVSHARQMVRDGADIIDVGGESTRPGSDAVATEEELARVIPIIEALAKDGVPISIDSRKAEVLSQAIHAGATIINDVSALTFDDGSLGVAARSSVPVILMHAQGDPKTMQEAPNYDHVLLDIYDYLEGRVNACLDAGLELGQCVVDPGIGFGKTLEHNLTLLSGLSLFHGLGCAVMLGTSRKSFIAALGRGEPAHRRLAGSIASVIDGAGQGVQIFRVHDVFETRQALDVWLQTDQA
jgi:dihydropteroate synthase